MDCAKSLKVSSGHLSARFKTLGQGSLKHHLDRRRGEWARSMLLFGDHGVGEVGASCGFSDAAAFSRFYKRVMGENPSRIRSKGISSTS